MAETKKFVETASVTVSTPSDNPFTKVEDVPTPASAPVSVNPLTAHDKLWVDTKALILDAKRLGIDFEVLLRGALQEIEGGKIRPVA